MFFRCRPLLLRWWRQWGAAMGYCLLVLSLFLMPTSVYAQHAGERCYKFGQTIVADNKRGVLVCLRASSSGGALSRPLIWMLNTSASTARHAEGDTGIDPFQTITYDQKAR